MSTQREQPQNTEKVYFYTLNAWIAWHQLDDRGKKINDLFGYIKYHLEGNEQVIWDIGDKCIHNSWQNSIYTGRKNNLVMSHFFNLNQIFIIFKKKIAEFLSR